MPSNATKNKLRKKAAEFTDKLRQPINVLKVHLKVYNFTGKLLGTSSENLLHFAPTPL